MEMSVDDVEGLIAILRLLQEVNFCPFFAAIISLFKVARGNDRNRLALLENSAWRPLELLFMFLSCPVPSSLKAELMHSISVFAGDPTTAAKVFLFNVLLSDQPVSALDLAAALGIANIAHDPFWPEGYL